MRPLLLGLALSATSAAPGIAAEPKEPAATQPSLTDVNKKLSNPVSDLWSITFQQNNYWLTLDSPYDGGRWSSNLLFQPVLPIAISGSWNLITRPVIPIFVSQPHPRQSDPQDLDRTTTFGDTTLLQLVSPGDSLVGKWLLGAGPSWIFPTANSDFTGFGKWQVGPAAIAGYLDEKWIIGALMQHDQSRIPDRADAADTVGCAGQRNASATALGAA